jgi:2-phospho-L-lactate guanylyltransferase
MDMTPTVPARCRPTPAYDEAVNAAVLVPVKAFRDAKGRLEPVLSPAQRQQLARWTAERVLAAAGELPKYVVCDDDDVAEWAVAHGAEVLREEGRGLNGAVDRAVQQMGAAGRDHVLVVHGDLPRPGPLVRLVRHGTVTIVPDRRLDGTNVLGFPLAHPIAASYGGASFNRHLAAAMASGVPVEVVRDRFLGLDIDHPADLLHPLVKDVLPAWLPTNPANQTPLR